MVGLPRSLAYADLWVWYIEQNWANSDCEGSPILLDNDYNYIALELSAEQWGIIFSCILTGGDLVYPERSQEVLWWWLKGVECVVDFCDKVLSCFNDASFVNSFVEKLSQQGVQLGGQGTGTTGAPTGSTVAGGLLPDDLDCNSPTELFGFCMNVVDLLNRMTEDFLQVVELYTNGLELGAKIVELFPIFGTFLSQAVATADKWLENIAETYVGAYTLAIQEQIACQIYEIAKENCTLTLQDILTAYANALVEPITSVDDFLDAIDIYLNISDITSLGIVIAAHALPLNLLNFGQEFLGYSVRSIPLWLGSYSGYPKPDDCGGWCYNFDFTASNGGFTVIAGRNCQWVSGEGWKPLQYTAFGNRYNNVSIEKTFTASTITGVLMVFTSTVNQNTANTYDQFSLMIDTTEIANVAEIATTHALPYPITWEGNEAGINKFVCQANAGSKTGTGAFSGGNAGDCTLISLTFYGTGTNPFGISNC